MIRVSLCQRNKARHIMTWYARIFDTETKEIRYESLGTTKKTEATDLMLAKQADGDFLKKSSCMTLEDAFSRYLKTVEDKGASQDTLYFANEALMSLKPLYTREVPSITKMEILEAFNRRNENVAPSTYNSRKQYVKTAFKFIVNVLELIPSSPAEILQSRKNLKRERDFWTVEQIEMILDCAPDGKHRLLWSLMAFAGLRIHEALKAVPTDVRDGFLYVLGKGNKPAKVQISSRLEQEIRRSGYSWDFSGMTRKNHALAKACKIAFPNGMTGSANNHRFRHSFASNLIRAGVNIKSVQKLMRHSNIQTTLNIYAHLIDNDMKEDVEKMFVKI